MAKARDTKETSDHSILVSNVTDHDVLCGRGTKYCQHYGNKRYHLMVEMNCTAYGQAQSKEEKTKISRSIVESLRNAEPPGRFLQKHERENDLSGKEIWQDIGEKKAWQKTSQLLRETVSKGDHRTVYQKRKWDKQLRRKERREKHARIKQKLKLSLPSSSFSYSSSSATNTFYAAKEEMLMEKSTRSALLAPFGGEKVSPVRFQEGNGLTTNTHDSYISSTHKTSLKLIHDNSITHNIGHPTPVQMVRVGCSNPVMNNTLSMGNHQLFPYPNSTIAQITPFLGPTISVNANLTRFGDYNASLPSRRNEFTSNFKTNPYENNHAAINTRMLNLPQNMLVSSMNQSKNHQHKTNV